MILEPKFLFFINSWLSKCNILAVLCLSFPLVPGQECSSWPNAHLESDCGACRHDCATFQGSDQVCCSRNDGGQFLHVCFCMGALKLEMSNLFTTFVLWTSIILIIVLHYRFCDRIDLSWINKISLILLAFLMQEVTE